MAQTFGNLILQIRFNLTFTKSFVANIPNQIMLRLKIAFSLIHLNQSSRRNLRTLSHLLQKCVNKFFTLIEWKVSIFGVIQVRIWTEYQAILRISPYSILMQENADYSSCDFNQQKQLFCVATENFRKVIVIILKIFRKEKSFFDL